MTFLKTLFILIVIVFLNACESDTPKVLIGYKWVEYHPIRGKEEYPGNDEIIIISEDSIDYIPLWHGCIIAPARRKKFKLYRNDKYEAFVINSKDTVKVNFEQVNSNVYKRQEGKSEFFYFTATNEKVLLNTEKVIESIERKPFQVLNDVKETIFSFYEEGDVVIKYNTDIGEFIKRGEWFIEESSGYHFLIIDDFDQILKFQITNISEEGLRAVNFNSEDKEEVFLSKVLTSYLPDSTRLWRSNIKQYPLMNRKETKKIDSPSGYWLWKNNTFIVYDTATLHQLDQDTLQTSVLIDWNCNAIICDYNVILGFDKDVLNKNRIRLYPTDEEGRVNKGISKSFYLE